MFCGERVFDKDANSTPCSHILFIASSLGYVYESDVVTEVFPDFVVDEEEEGYFVDRLKQATGFPGDCFFIEFYTTDDEPGCIGLSPSSQ